MKNTDEKVKPGWEIPRAVKEEFVDFCGKIGTRAQEDCAGSLFIWQHLPAQIREWAKLGAKNQPVVNIEFWKGFQEGIRLQIPRLLETHPRKKKSGGS